MREQLQLRKFRIVYLILFLFWVLSLWICYWSGYWGGFVSSMRGEYAFVSAGVLYDIGMLRDIEKERISLKDTKRLLTASIQTKLETLSGTKKLLDDERPYLRQFLYSFYDTPMMVYSLQKDRDNFNLIDISEIEKKYQAIGSSDEDSKRRK